MAEEKLNLYQKMEKIRKIAEVAQKDSSGYGYKYTSITSILAKVKAGMNKYHVLLIPILQPRSQNVRLERFSENKTTKTGEFFEKVSYEYRVESQIVYRWIDVENPEDKIDVPWFVVGSQKDPSQAMGSALTYAERYFLTQFFQIATPEDDPDAWRSQKQEAAEEEDRDIAQAIIKELHEGVTAHLEKFPDDKENIVKITKKHVKDGKKASANYFIVKSPDVATALVAEIAEHMAKVAAGANDKDSKLKTKTVKKEE